MISITKARVHNLIRRCNKGTFNITIYSEVRWPSEIGWLNSLQSHTSLASRCCSCLETTKPILHKNTFELWEGNNEHDCLFLC